MPTVNIRGYKIPPPDQNLVREIEVGLFTTSKEPVFMFFIRFIELKTGLCCAELSIFEDAFPAFDYFKDLFEELARSSNPSEKEIIQLLKRLGFKLIKE